MQYTHEIREKKARYTGPRPSLPERRPEWADMMRDYLRDRNLSYLLARHNGWYPASYSNSPRIVIPCTNISGFPYFQARDMTGKSSLRYASPPAPREDSIVIVWPWDDATIVGEPNHGAVVLEGPMDALAVADLGFLGVALMGNQPTPDVLAHVAKMVRAFSPVIVVPDVDCVEFGATVVCALSQVNITSTILMPWKKDIGEMTRKERAGFFDL